MSESPTSKDLFTYVQARLGTIELMARGDNPTAAVKRIAELAREAMERLSTHHEPKQEASKERLSTASLDALIDGLSESDVNGSGLLHFQILSALEELRERRTAVEPSAPRKPTNLQSLCDRLAEIFNTDDTPDELSTEAREAIENLWESRDDWMQWACHVQTCTDCHTEDYCEIGKPLRKKVEGVWFARPAVPPGTALDELQSLSGFLGAGGIDCNDPAELGRRIRWGIDHHLRAALERAASAIEPTDVTTLIDKDYGTKRDVRQAGVRRKLAAEVRALMPDGHAVAAQPSGDDGFDKHGWWRALARKAIEIADENFGYPARGHAVDATCMCAYCKYSRVRGMMIEPAPTKEEKHPHSAWYFSVGGGYVCRTCGSHAESSAAILATEADCTRRCVSSLVKPDSFPRGETSVDDK